jgi:hypothetical protein
MMIDGLKKKVVGKSLFLGFIVWNMIMPATCMDVSLAECGESDGIKGDAMLESPYPELSEHVNYILESIVEKTREDKILASFETPHQNISDTSTSPFQGTDFRKKAISNSHIKVHSSPQGPKIRRASSGNMYHHPIERVKSQEKFILQAVICETQFQG